MNRIPPDRQGVVQRILGFVWLLAVVLTSTIDAQPQHDGTPVTYDLVILHGRVMNPETGFDSVANVGIVGGTVREISQAPMKGRKEIDATGLVVAPGFIDILSYDPNPVGSWNKIADGVTTNLAMHGGSANPKTWYAEYERQHPPVNFGASFFYTEARNRFALTRYQSASKEQIRKLTQIAEHALQNGSLGVSFSPEYVPGISSDEILPLMALAKKYNVPVFFHARYSDMEEPGTNFDALNEIIGYARQSGASVHIDHINSTGGTFSMKRSLQMLQTARESGLDITACTYPYNFWGTYLNSARFDKGWQQRFHISYGDLQLAGTSERLTEESFRKYQKEGKLAVAYAIPEEDIVAALASPFVMIGSDAILGSGYNNHPRASGTFARTIGLYAREQKILSVLDAVAKMTILPAHRLEQCSEAMKRKGRMAVGADADITIFSLSDIRDRSTVEHPEYQSAGIEYVVVNGQIVKDLQGIHKNIRAGKPIRNSVDQKR
ncbi:MAG: amidohydrolase family protein [Bacteroidota bacterium]